MSLLRDVLAANPGDHKMAEARVISSTEDVPARCFSGWSAGWVNTNSSVDSMEAVDGNV